MQKEASNQTHELDVGVTLKTYIQKTASFRRAENLFIIPNGEKKRASSVHKDSGSVAGQDHQESL